MFGSMVVVIVVVVKAVFHGNQLQKYLYIVFFKY